jgi:tripartite-type tricarboxylate transporter receptor subunit TctC
MKILRREFLALAAARVSTLTAVTKIAKAQTYPSRPVRIIVGFAPGGAVDTVARLIGQWLSERLGQPFVIENRPGAGTNIATEAVIRSPPDGYMLLAAVSSNTVNPALYPNLSFNFIRDVAMVAGLTRAPLVLEVNPSLPVASVPELIGYVKANPGQISLASFGSGTISHVAGVLFKREAGIEMAHVPYRGSAPMLVDLLGGQVQAGLDSLQSSIEYIRAGKLRALAVTSATRAPVLPDIPVLGDFLSGFEASTWIGIGAPKITPVEIIDRLNKEINVGLADPNIVARIANLGSTTFRASPADLDRFVREETGKWEQVIRAENIRPD